MKATKPIERNTTILQRRARYSTAADNQTAVDINVVQERQFAKDTRVLDNPVWMVSRRQEECLR